MRVSVKHSGEIGEKGAVDIKNRVEKGQADICGQATDNRGHSTLAFLNSFAVKHFQQ